MKVALVYDVARWEERALLEALKARGVSVEIFHTETFSFELGRKAAEVALQRSLSHAAALSSTIALESGGTEVINNSRAIATAHNKLWTLSLLHRQGIRVPRTYLALSERAALSSSVALGFPLVVKPVDGSWGRLVSLAKEEETLRAIVEHRELMGDPRMKVHLLQEFVEKPGRDIRVFVVGDEVPVAIYRVSNHWITNTSRGGRAVPAPIDAELAELALKASRAVGTEIAGIDVFESKEGLLVNEVNAVPDFRNTVAVTGYDLAGKMVEYLLGRARK
ncbi:MAG: lysine biosynthesis protein LysX [Acidilobaceae archaeon]|nr:lysine biosynthesis protein LysX [Acidilobaceae archaeon]MCX8165939.1 lysine biosynthesis protein LysX [Acidilobaceae archaeon]MDW7974582.1 lysine biosynthesis protein LysX [Sulfolobales archaeon]